ncbi:MAG: hypothetical protein ACI83D_000226, partial [Planctomycetota bacterium]
MVQPRKHESSLLSTLFTKSVVFIIALGIVFPFGPFLYMAPVAYAQEVESVETTEVVGDALGEQEQDSSAGDEAVLEGQDAEDTTQRSSARSVGDESGGEEEVFTPSASRGFVDESSGAYKYSYGFTLPGGHNGMTPNLSLDYDSRNQDYMSSVGFGFELSIPYITRVNSYGIENMYTRGDFVASDGGKLVSSDSDSDQFGSYVTKTSGLQPAGYEYSVDDTWVKRTSDGMMYTYGSSDASRFSDPNYRTHVGKWYLDSVVDMLGNTISYTYAKYDDITMIAAIDYTSLAGVAAPHRVEFSYEDRGDKANSAAMGFWVESTKRLSKISVLTQGELRRVYDMAYEHSIDNGASMISEIQETGFDINGGSAAANPVVFTYTKNEPDQEWEAVARAEGNEYLFSKYVGVSEMSAMDFNGDGFSDALYSYYDKQPQVFLNDTHNNFVYSQDFTQAIPHPLNAWHYNKHGGGNTQYSLTSLVDMNSDGYVDIFNNGNGVTLLNNGEEFVETENWGSMPFSTQCVGCAIFDINGDGRPDLFQSLQGYKSYLDKYNSAVNTGTSF